MVVDVGATRADREAGGVVGPGLLRAGMVGPLVGGDAWAMHYYDGERLDVFGLALGVHYFLCLIFEGTNRGAFGPVMMYGRRVADQIIQMLGPAAYQTRPAEASPARTEPDRLRPSDSRQTQPQDERNADLARSRPDGWRRRWTSLTWTPCSGRWWTRAWPRHLSPDALGRLAASLGSTTCRVDYSDAIDMGIRED